MKIVKYAKYVDAMIGPEGYFHRWTVPQEKFIQRLRKKHSLLNASWNGWSSSKIALGIHFRV